MSDQSEQFNENIVCTIICQNYIAQARTLFQSLQVNHGRIHFYVLVVDLLDDNKMISTNDKNFHVIYLKELRIFNLESFTFKYNVTEMCTAVKPYFLSLLVDKFKYSKIIYLDPDIYVYQSLNIIYELLNDFSIILTPHLSLSSLPDDGCIISDEFILVSGAYNLGFLALANTQVAHNFLKWWQSKLYDKCVINISHGLFVDQKWIDLVPGMFDDVHILREPGYNVAYWNLHERNLVKVDNIWYCNGKLLYFYHFSGLVIDELELISRHQNRFDLSNLPNLKLLFDSYKEKLLANNYLETCVTNYVYNYYSDGSPISQYDRKCYYLLGLDGQKKFPNPFDTRNKKSFKNHLWKIRPVMNIKSRLLDFVPEKLILLFKSWLRKSISSK
ncbi:hypothetical protein IQ225_06980 [Synechocystis salina LEGE 06155]|nr:hypothetical protein [Synechocystis salina LEGE 06155]